MNSQNPVRGHGYAAAACCRRARTATSGRQVKESRIGTEKNNNRFPELMREKTTTCNNKYQITTSKELQEKTALLNSRHSQSRTRTTRCVFLFVKQIFPPIHIRSTAISVRADTFPERRAQVVTSCKTEIYSKKCE